MSNEKQIEIFQRALDRERKARKQAEKILEEKSLELFTVTQQLKSTNSDLKELVRQKKSELKGVFENINDAFVLIDLSGDVLKMNDAAIEMFGYNHKEETVNLMKLLHPDDFEYTVEAFKGLLKKGSYTKYRSRIISKNKTVKFVEVNSSLVYDKQGVAIAAQGIARDITQEIAIQELLEEQKKQFNIIFENSPIGISLSRQNEKGLLFVNKSLCKMLGYSVEEFQNKQVQDTTHPDDEEMSRLHREKLFRGDIDSFTLEKRYIKKNGEILWAKTIVTAVRGTKEEIKFQVATIEDIGKEKLAKEKLIASENRLATLILNLDSGVLLEDENRKLILANKKFCEFFNVTLPPEKIIGYDCSVATSNKKNLFEDPELFESRVNSIVSKREVFLADELKMKDGKILERDFIPIFNNENVYKGHLSTYRDVTLNKKYRESLEAQKQKYSNIIANINLGLVEVDINNKILLVNQTFVNMSGFSEKEMIGKNSKKFFSRKEEKTFIDKKKEDRKQGISDSYEFKFTNRWGQERYWLVSGAPNYDLKGNIIGSIGVLLDITDNKILEFQKESLLKKLRESNEELEEYAHIVSHDLKSPLRSISALTSWLKEDYENVLEKEGIVNLNLIEETVEKMENLINDILNYSSINNSLSVIENVSVCEVVNHIKSLIFIPNHVEVIVDEKLPVIKADKTRIQQLFQNLMGNAVNYIDKEKGIVEVSYVEEKEAYIFSIKDNGVGIPKEYHQKIFNIFQSLGNHKDSTGIGLSIVKKIVDMYDGDIWLESEQGIGTTFFIKLRK
ncbi:PAS/PAC sensor signal transduction histidine kinase [Tenacibaculum adriaticum]|uniref:histidine kinase n=1 Tax=Tenacibaculum adriaticum TaxID=413713 RepID=A0A5S5DMU0_9FLAO|nr:PAS domain S-box protein [Tenacibaculum adriaticum]TYP96708.1 PAS/PAC sensor signal transduction histidine kinase [Tenacibaculum adriaticum]